MSTAQDLSMRMPVMVTLSWPDARPATRITPRNSICAFRMSIPLSQFFGGGQGRGIVRLGGHFLHVLNVTQSAALVHHENSARLDAQFLDVCAIGVSERHVAVI